MIQKREGQGREIPARQGAGDEPLEKGNILLLLAETAGI